MANLPPDVITDVQLAQTWGFASEPNTDPAVAESGPLTAWTHFNRAVGRNLPAHVNRVARLRRQIRALGQR